MSAEREALKLALEALEYRGGSTWLKRGIAVEAIKEALAQPPRQALTPGAIRNLYARHCDPVDFARAVEAAYEASAKR